MRELITWAWKEKKHVVPYFHSSDFIISITTIHIGHAASAVQPLQIDSFMATAARSSSRLLAALVSSTLLLLLLFVPPAARGARRDHQLPAAAVLVRVPAAGPARPISLGPSERCRRASAPQNPWGPFCKFCYIGRDLVVIFGNSWVTLERAGVYFEITSVWWED